MPDYIMDKKRYGIEEILEQIGEEPYIELDGKKVRINTRTLKCFRYKGTTCASCGREGVFFKLVRYKELDYYHPWLFARHEKHGIVLMTKDHIYPKSLGGTDGFENLQVMCATCNSKKGSEVQEAQVAE